MTITSKAKHDTCRVQIDCNTTNAHGRPALEFSGDPVPFLKKPKSVNTYYHSNISVTDGAREPEYTDGVSNTIEQHTPWF